MLFRIVRLNPTPVLASCIVNLCGRGRQCHNTNPVAIEFAARSQCSIGQRRRAGREVDRANHHDFSADSEGGAAGKAARI